MSIELDEKASIEFGYREENHHFVPVIKFISEGKEITFTADWQFESLQDADAFMEELYQILTNKDLHTREENYLAGRKIEGGTQ